MERLQRQPSLRERPLIESRRHLSRAHPLDQLGKQIRRDDREILQPPLLFGRLQDR